MTSFRSAILLFTILAVSVSAAPTLSQSGEEPKSGGGGGIEEIPLSVQLEGLPPEARLAYLRHLMSDGRSGPDVLFQTAVAFHELDQADSAMNYYEKTIMIDPANFKAHVNMGVLLDDRGNYARAIKSFATAATLNPDDVLAHSHLAFLLYRNGDYKAAWNHLERALEIAPEHPQPHFYLAIFFWEARIYMEAMREWEKVIELEPEGFLAAKARENIILLQKALNSPAEDGEFKPER